MLDDAGSTPAPTVPAPTVPAPTVPAPDPASPGRLLHSDPHDFAGLYIRHHSSFTLHARRHLRDQRDADEVVQEAFLRLFLALPELETELQALAYCRRTITNLCIDRYRTQARRPRLVDLDSAPVDLLVDDDPGDPVVRAEDAALVREALSLLSPLHRAALVKREIEEKPLPVIAQELSIPEDNVKHLLFRARRALRRLLAGTALAPGVDDERGSGLVTAGKAGSGGLGALVLLLVLGLGSGPNLEAVPVVGVDLPDVLGVERVVRTVGEAVTGVVDRVSPASAPAPRPLGVGDATGGSAADAEQPGAGQAPAGPGTPRGSAVPAAGADGSPAAPGGTTKGQAPAPGAAGALGAGSVVVRPVPTRPRSATDVRPVPAVGSGGAPQGAPAAPSTAGGAPAPGAPTPGAGGAAGAPAANAPSAPVPVVPPRADTPAAKAEAAAAKAEARQEAAAAKAEAEQEAAAAKAQARQEAARAEAEQEAAEAEARQEAAAAKAAAAQAKADAKAQAKAAAAQAKADAKAQAEAEAAQAKQESGQVRSSLTQGASDTTAPTPVAVVPTGG